MSNQTAWFVAGLIALLLVSQGSPKIAGLLVILLVTYLAIEATKPGHLQ